MYPIKSSSVRLGFLLLFKLASSASNYLTVLPIPFSDQAGHGPDGPWNYITLNVGLNPLSTLDFYPLLSDHGDLLITDNACSKTTCLSPSPNYYNQNSESAKNSSLDQTLSTIDGSTSWDAAPELNLKGSGYWSTATIHNPTTFNNTLVYVSSNVTQGLGKFRYTPVSLLSLEPFLTANKTKLAKGGYIEQNTMFESFHDQFGGAQTFGVHIGSSKFNQSGSLYFGGFDQNRLIEKPAVFNTHSSPQLKGIKISGGDGTGSSPWADSLQKPPANILTQPIPVTLSPHVPNLMLPQSVCQGIAQFLPVMYNQDTNLYFWNTTSPVYKELTSSAEYHLDFTWGDSASTTIKVPFALLDLTLMKPVADTPTAYFPCSASNTTHLGRAFLQAAILMQSYSPDTIVIGQAPGPLMNQTVDAVPVAYNTTNSSPGPATQVPKWEDTWAPYLDGTLAKTSSSSRESSGSDAGTSPILSTAAIIGIAVGSAFVMLLVGCLIWCLYKQGSNKKQSGEDVQLQQQMPIAQDTSPAQQQYMLHAGVNGGWKPPRPPRPPSHLARLED